jgi:2-C-methyl-D-erythritol 4-phosphate cytidylyltransferase
MVTSIIAAGGKGIRMQSRTRKQYLHLDGMPVLARTLKVFNDCPAIDQILLVVPGEDFEFVRQNTLPFIHPEKSIMLVSGGDCRQNSVYNGITKIKNKDCIVVVHDGVRPFVTCEDIVNGIQAAEEYGAGILGIPVDETLKQANDVNFIEKTIERDRIWVAQTPQVFRYKLLRDAHESAIKRGITGTDDAFLVEDLGWPVKMVKGNKYNIKITTPEDMKFAQAIVKIKH